MSNRAVVFDSGTLINLSLNGLLYVLEGLKKSFKGKLLITEQVKYEVIDRPMGISKFELGALRVKALLESGVLEMPESIGISSSLISSRTNEFMTVANKVLVFKGQPVQIVSAGEMSCLALSAELTAKGVDNIISIDERTTRVLCEEPRNLERILSAKLHQRLQTDISKLKMFSNFKFIRTTELVYAAFKLGLIAIEDKKALEALLYATKFKGASISFEEIDVLKKM